MTLTATYVQTYALTSESIAFYAKAVSEKPSRILLTAFEKKGVDGLMAVLDALLDAGYRNVLVQASVSPALPDVVREKMETLLYGQRRQSLCALTSTPRLH